MGVKAMNLPEGEHIVALAVVHDGDEILTVTAGGYGKRTDIADYPLQGRAGKGVKAGAFNDKTGALISLQVIPEGMDVMMITDSGVIIRVDASEISKIGRATQGVRVMKLKGDVNVMAVALTPCEEDDESAEAEGVDETVSETEETNPVIADETTDSDDAE